MKNFLKKYGILSLGMFLAILLATTVGRTAIQTIAGLAVAQTSTTWNNLKDAAAGDNLTNGVGVFNPYLFDGTNFDRWRGSGGSANIQGTVTPADNTANPTTAITTFSLNGVYDGTTWDLVRGGSNASDAQATTAAGNAQVLSFGMGWNGTTFDRLRSGSTAGDNIATTTTGNGNVLAYNLLWDGSTWDRAPGNSTTGALVQTPTSGSAFFAITKADLGTSSSNQAFGFTSKKVAITAPSTNTANICIDWTGGTAVCPSANTAGDDVFAAGKTIILDDYAVTSVSAIAASGTQSVIVEAWN